MLPAGEQRSVVAGGISTARGETSGFGPRVESSIHKATLPEIVLEVVFCHAANGDGQFAAHHTVQSVTFPLYQFRKIFYVHNHQ